ncbi:hypothetical protein [Bacillus inaquosorum]|uniref:hypothetical protein n=1 Tax=Bacillus inaquosorum TaxID=483913 RepID=UPI00227FD1B7|nr:hypothetical protein [Bacillus inaquosorum]MCY8056497.1 hypothetical protein [Bacillus inaquosorum]MCY9397650.1 hypothetical protein [Bacillus inaquosorum]
MNERLRSDFLKAVAMASAVMLMVSIAFGDVLLIGWLYSNGLVIWSYITGGFSIFVFLVIAFWYYFKVIY